MCKYASEFLEGDFECLHSAQDYLKKYLSVNDEDMYDELKNIIFNMYNGHAYYMIMKFLNFSF